MDEPSNGELGRLIQALRGDVRDDLGQINARLDKVVPMDVYSIQQQTLADRVTALEKQREKDTEKLVATRRWLIGVVVTVATALLPYLITLVKGAGA